MRLGYVVHDEEGTSVERGRSQVVLGYGQLLPGVESALTGARAGARLTVELPPEQAYGARDPQAILEIERGELPPDVQPGDQLEAEHAEGGVVVLTVLEVAQDAVRVDTNHPLAGQKVRFELEVESVRPATDEELDRAAEQVERALRSPGPSGSENAGLIPTQRLLDRPPRR